MAIVCSEAHRNTANSPNIRLFVCFIAIRDGRNGEPETADKKRIRDEPKLAADAFSKNDAL